MNAWEQSPVGAAVGRFERARFLPWATPLEHQPRLSQTLGIDLRVKRDDLTGLAFGGNKVRKLEFYFGKALAAGADTVLITGAVQSNYTRVVAACAARLGMDCHIQLEERVPDVDDVYRTSGNVLLDELLGATLHAYPVGEDEEGADQRLREIAAGLSARGRRPYVIPLGAGNPPLGALGYVRCAAELLEQAGAMDHVVLASGSGQTHAGLLFGLRALGWSGEVIGICVRRAASLQKPRVEGHCGRIAELLGIVNPVRSQDVVLYDDVLAPGYGVMNDAVASAIRDCAHRDGLLVEPVYTGRAMAGLFARVREGRLPPGARVVFIHTGGLPALFGYATDLRRTVVRREITAP
ncbi:D-cysteine desulfhydrase family protein [Reyranella sp. CPCC 100927]|uniref:D-cysteine desulfhydrase family protein n=1 Tax=Reyranella sp. CPCC 100927 TaxID=2599616 RepID=UPI0011B6E9FA|nr:D-cysteine desulfhydrase family protein [Reyranella sp. CPCC 100927]TWT12562.1 D-cysteine desulfhydrase family protein [Reyranella sp. CPCC 100927]